LTLKNITRINPPRECLRTGEVVRFFAPLTRQFLITIDYLVYPDEIKGHLMQTTVNGAIARE
jgi:hypothetical protein